jgi:uncharacterized protein (TIGR00288 family)
MKESMQATTARPATKQGPPVHAPNAALLIDFDNVTMGIRSDLQVELRRLLNSEIIRGKVAVQRAYADWRRYPQYIVPLSEASIDLIFAPAFGSNKKNATDIRLAIDALELVFTRPEIGTFILLSGDSDFSSLVIKLKEYGKYVIGVGIRESSSDLLIQNCDEYYSYTELTGLTRETAETPAPRDPWELVVDAVLEMKKRGDVMRSDRLKQVMQELDPAFDEKNVGISRFSKFVDEARQRGLVTATKLQNGQYEIDLGPRAPGGEQALPPIPGEADERRSRERAEQAREEAGRPRGRERRGPGGPQPRAAAPPPPAGAHVPLSLAEAFELLKRALRHLGAFPPGVVGEDVVRGEMVRMLGRDDDPIFHRPRFGRFLRQAHDASIVDLRKNQQGYEMSLRPEVAATAAAAAPAEEAEASPRRRTRRGGRGRGREGGRAAEHGGGGGGAPPAVPAATEREEVEAHRRAAEQAGPASPAARPVGRGIRYRRGSRSGGAAAAQVPLVGVVEIADESADSGGAGRARKPRSGSRRRGGSAGRKAKGERAAEE